MLYFFDTEFHEDKTKVELISIGVVREDGKEYYAQTIETSHKQCNEWVKQHVIPKLILCPRGIHRDDHKWILKGECGDRQCFWRTHDQIKDDLLEFTEGDVAQWWADWGATDWLLLYRLFGTMMSIPKHWKYFLDLYDFEKYILDLVKMHGHPKDLKRPKQPLTEKHHALCDARFNFQKYQYLQSILQSINGTGKKRKKK